MRGSGTPVRLRIAPEISGIVGSVAFSVLFVCTGNICRSPLAERLFLARTGGDPRLVTASAGTMGLIGHPMDDISATVLRELGGDPDGHRGRRLTAELVAGADLILGAEAVHRSAVLRLDPLAFRRTFTMREFARLGSGLMRPSRRLALDELAERVFEVASRRGWSPVVESVEDDIADPIGLPLPPTRKCAQQIADALDAAIAILGLTQPEVRYGDAEPA